MKHPLTDGSAIFCPKRLSEALRQVLEEDFSPAELYQVVYALGVVHDEAVKAVADMCLDFDEDYLYVMTNKDAWDRVQRWLLILDSDYQVSTVLFLPFQMQPKRNVQRRNVLPA